jgi:hypothetical protein
MSEHDWSKVVRPGMPEWQKRYAAWGKLHMDGLVAKHRTDYPHGPVDGARHILWMLDTQAVFMAGEGQCEHPVIRDAQGAIATLLRELEARDRALYYLLQEANLYGEREEFPSPTFAANLDRWRTEIIDEARAELAKEQEGDG